MEKISDYKDLQEILKRYLNEDLGSDNIQFVLDPNFNLNFSIRLIAPEFDSNINTSAMKAILKFQETINTLYSYYLYGCATKLSPEQKKRCELYITIDKGSSIINFLLDKIFNKEIFNKMEEKTKKIAIIATAIGVLGSVAIGQTSGVIKSFIEKDTTILENEKDKELVQTICEENRKFVEALSKIETKVEIDNNLYSPEELKEFSKPIKEEKLKSSDIFEGLFDIKTIDLSKKDEADIYINVFHHDSSTFIENVALQSDYLSAKDYEIIKDAVNKKPVNLTIHVDYVGKKQKQAYIDIHSIDVK